MLFNILLVLLVTCFATATPTVIFAKESKHDIADVTIENAAHSEDNNDQETDDDEFPMVDAEDEETDEGDELGNVSFDGTSEHTFNFDEFEEDGGDKD